MKNLRQYSSRNRRFGGVDEKGGANK